MEEYHLISKCRVCADRLFFGWHVSECELHTLYDELTSTKFEFCSLLVNCFK